MALIRIQVCRGINIEKGRIAILPTEDINCYDALSDSCCDEENTGTSTGTTKQTLYVTGLRIQKTRMSASRIIVYSPECLPAVECCNSVGTGTEDTGTSNECD